MKIRDRETERWELKSWLWVFFFSLFIFSTVPLARGVQRFVYSTIGKEFFTYAVFLIVLVALTILLYLFVFKLRIRRVSQYIYLLICASIYGYFIIRLKEHPEEAIHFVEYGILYYLFFVALSKKIRDRTIYITSAFFVLFVGTLDEFLQWMMPERFWDFRDVGFNALAGVIFMFGLWKGIRPENINRPVKRLSVNVLLWIITINLLFLGLCLSNTPKTVNYYAERLNLLSRLKDEEIMAEYGHKHIDPEIGIFYSRPSLKQLREVDAYYGSSYGEEIANAFERGMTYEDLITAYSPPANPFLYEFVIHLERRDNALKNLEEPISLYTAMRSSDIAFKENLILERYFSNTLSYSGYTLPDEIIAELRENASPGDKIYISRVGNLITIFNLRTAWSVILITIIALWTGGSIYKRRL